MTTRSTRSPRRRTVVALAVVLAVLAGFVVRLVDIQVVNAREHIDDSLSIATGVSKEIFGTRGSIVDMDGQTLAGSNLLYDAALDPSNVRTIDRTDENGQDAELTWPQAAAEIGAITGQTAEDVQKVVADAQAADSGSQYARLVQRLSTEQYRALADLDLPYLSFEPHPARTYPDGAVGGNLVGFVGSDGTALAGLELAQGACLDATDGKVTYERGKDGVMIPGTEKETPAVDGGTLQLTIDRDLQWYLQQLIAEQVQDQGALNGTITVVEVGTGKIRAAAEYPTVDPNDIDASPAETWRSRIFTDTFEPGSTFKALTAAMLIDSGTATPTSTETVPGSIYFPDGARVFDALGHDDQLLTLAGVLINSSNVGASLFGSKLAPQTRYDYLKRFGIGDGSAVDFYGEAQGLVHPVDQWDPQTSYNTTFGQGLTTTVPELVGAYQAIANDGVKVPLSLVESCTRPDGTVETPEAPEPTRVISEQAAQDVQHILENVATQGGLSQDVQIPGYLLAFKTGTGEKIDPATGGYKQGVYFTTLIGFAPADDPQYVVAVTLNEPTRITSSAANAEAFQKAMTQVLKTFRVLPTGGEATYIPELG